MVKTELLTFSRALLSAKKVLAKIEDGPVVELAKSEVRKHYRRDNVPFEWEAMEDGTLRIGRQFEGAV